MTIFGYAVRWTAGIASTVALLQRLMLRVLFFGRVRWIVGLEWHWVMMMIRPLKLDYLQLFTLYLTLIALASWISDFEAPTDDECPIGLMEPLSETCGWAGGGTLAAWEDGILLGTCSRCECCDDATAFVNCSNLSSPPDGLAPGPPSAKCIFCWLHDTQICTIPCGLIGLALGGADLVLMNG